MSYRPQHLKRGVSKPTPGYIGKHRLSGDPQPALCPNDWHNSAPARAGQPCPECPPSQFRSDWMEPGECPDSCPFRDARHLHETRVTA